MSDEKLIETLEKFSEYLSQGSIISDGIRLLGWLFVKGIAFIVDGLEKVTNDLLFVKTFFENPEVVTFVESIRPFLYILLAFSILYAGYLLIFQKKFDREGMAINLFIAMIVILLLSPGMEKANDFTDEAIKAVKTGNIYGDDSGTLSQSIFSSHIYDLVEFDKNGWKTTELEKPNSIPLNLIGKISITEKFDSGRGELKMSNDGKDISKRYLIWAPDGLDTAKFDQGGLEWNNVYYYRFWVDWITLIATLIVIGFTLFSVAYKLARLAFELVFNYVLAIIIAPVDIHDGQKTKRIIQSILNTFIAIILIFLSMKIYMIGTAYLSSNLSGLAYVVALIGFSAALIDGPNIVERLFGVDAGLKGGLGLLTGTYATAKFITGTAKGISEGLKSLTGDNNEKDNDSNKSLKSNNSSKLGSDKAVSPNGEAEGKTEGANKVNGNAGKTKDGSTGGKGISNKMDGDQQKLDKNKAPSPNDNERVSADNNQSNTGKAIGQTGGVISPNASPTAVNVGGASQGGTTSGSNESQKVAATQNSRVQTDAEVASTLEQVQGTTSNAATQTGGASSPNVSPTAVNVGGASQGGTTSGSNESQKVAATQNSRVQTDAEVASTLEQVQGTTSNAATQTGGASSPNVSPTAVNVGGASQGGTTSGSNESQKVAATQNSRVQTDAEVASTLEQVQGTTSNAATQTGGASSPNVSPTAVNVGGASQGGTTSGSNESQKVAATQNSRVQTDAEVASTLEQVQGTTSNAATQTGGASLPNVSPTAVNVGGASQGGTTSGSDVSQKVTATQNSRVQTDAEVASTLEQVQGTTSNAATQTGGASLPNVSPTAVNVGGASQGGTTSGSDVSQKVTATQNSRVQTDAEVASTLEQVQGTTSNAATQTGGASSPNVSPTAVNVGGVSQGGTTSGSDVSQKVTATQNSRVQTDAEVASTLEQVQGTTSNIVTQTGGASSPNVSPTAVNVGGVSQGGTTSGSDVSQKVTATQNSRVHTENEVINNVEHTQDSSTYDNQKTGSGNIFGSNAVNNKLSERRRPSKYTLDNAKSNLINKIKNYKKL